MMLRNPLSDILSLPAATGSRVAQFFVRLLDSTTIKIRTLGSEIGPIREAILRHTWIHVVKQRLILGGRELQTGDTVAPESTISLLPRLRGGTEVHGRFQCLDVLSSVLQSPQLNTDSERTLRTYQQVSTTWRHQVQVSLQQSRWGLEFTKQFASAVVQIEAQHLRLKIALEVEDSVDTVLELMLRFPADQQTSMAGIDFLSSALQRPASGVSVVLLTDPQTRTMLNLVLRTMGLHRFQRTPWDPRPSVLPAVLNTEMGGGGTRILSCLNPLVALTYSKGWSSAMDARPHEGLGGFLFHPRNLTRPDLGFLGPILLHFYNDVSLVIGPLDGSQAQFQDRLESEWGGIQTQGANCLQLLLETLDEAPLRTLLGGLAGKKWHWLVKHWTEIQSEYAHLVPAAGKAKKSEKWPSPAQLCWRKASSATKHSACTEPGWSTGLLR